MGYVDGELVHRAPVTHRLNLATDTQEMLQSTLEDVKEQVRDMLRERRVHRLRGPGVSTGQDLQKIAPDRCEAAGG